NLPHPLLTDAQIARTATFMQVNRHFDLTTDPYLNHHRLDGVPVLPMAVATEWMAEVAQLAWPTLKVVAIRDLEVLAGIKFKADKGRELRVMLRNSAESVPSTKRIVAHAQLLAENGRAHYRATIELAADYAQAEKWQLPEGLGDFGRSIADCYESWLFHGPTFQAISAISGINAEHLVIAIEPSDPNNVMQIGNGQWLLDPVMVDAGLQGALIWARQQLDVTPVPLGFKMLERFAPLANQPVTAHLQFVRDEMSQTLTIDIVFVNEAKQVLVKLLGIHGQYSRAFNRLGGHEKYAPFSLVQG
ncbi:MAG TPA: hypothetical protein ENJ56_05250, partial [Anaerolineae bacterium]|nr:hypothetical protein [Anaerolineae bacterium]